MILHVAVSSAILSNMTHVNDPACFLLESEEKTLLWLLQRSKTTVSCFLVRSYMDFITKLTVNLFFLAVSGILNAVLALYFIFYISSLLLCFVLGWLRQMNPEIVFTQNFLFASQGHIPAVSDSHKWIFCQNNVCFVQFYSYIYLYKEIEKDNQYALIARRRYFHVTCSSLCRSKDGSEAL